MLAEVMGLRRYMVELPPSVGLLAARVMGFLVRDVMLTRSEIGALMDGLLDTNSPPAGAMKLSNWARDNASELGRHYASELARRTLAPRDGAQVCAAVG